jgi:hypothetical protein
MNGSRASFWTCLTGKSIRRCNIRFKYLGMLVAISAPPMHADRGSKDAGE